MTGRRARALDFASRLRYFSLAESLGGVESLICHPARMTHGSIPHEDRERRGVTDGLLRLSVGIEDVEDLIDDLRSALAATPAAVPRASEPRAAIGIAHGRRVVAALLGFFGARCRRSAPVAESTTPR